MVRTPFSNRQARQVRTTLIVVSLVLFGPAPTFAQGPVTVASLPEGSGTGQVGILRGDLRLYDSLPSFLVDATGNVIVRDWINGRVQIVGAGGVTTVIAAPAGAPAFFPADMLVLPGGRVALLGGNRLAVFDYTGAEVAARLGIVGRFVGTEADGSIVLERPAGGGYDIVSANLSSLRGAAEMPLDLGRVVVRPTSQGRRWTVQFADRCYGFRDVGANPAGVFRRDSRVFVSSERSVWVLDETGVVVASGELPPDQLGPAPPPPVPAVDTEPILVAEYRDLTVGLDGEVYSMIRRPDAIEIVRWNLSQLQPAPGLASLPNAPPVLETIGARQVTVGQLLSFRVRATDADANPLTFEAQSLPTGATLDSLSGMFTWRPAANQAGTFSIVFRVKDDSCGVDTETVVITVAGLP